VDSYCLVYLVSRAHRSTPRAVALFVSAYRNEEAQNTQVPVHRLKVRLLGYVMMECS
jgi:hypothetical protein